MIPIGHRVPGAIVVVVLFTAAAVGLYLAQLEVPAAIFATAAVGKANELWGMLSAKADLRKSGYHRPLSPLPEPAQQYLPPPPPLPRRDQTARHGKREPTDRRDRITPMDRDIDQLIAARQYGPARQIAIELEDVGALERIRIAEEMERKAARRADDTRSRRERGDDDR